MKDAPRPERPAGAGAREERRAGGGGARVARRLRRAVTSRAVLGLLRMGARCPPAGRPALAAFFGSALRLLVPRRRRIAAANIEYCFPELSSRARARLVERHFRSLGFALIEIGLAWHAPLAKLRELVEVHGLEHLAAALARGRGALLLAGHFSTIEIGAMRIALETRIDGVYRPHDDPTMERASRAGRERFGGQLIGRDELRVLLRRLRENRAVWYAPDQDLGARRSVFAPFFGRPAATLTATARIAQGSGAAVVPFSVERRARGHAWRVVVEPALDGFPSGDAAADAARINTIIERWARERPEDYLWVHRRFKTRPPGEPPLYGGT